MDKGEAHVREPPSNTKEKENERQKEEKELRWEDDESSHWWQWICNLDYEYCIVNILIYFYAEALHVR